MGKNKIVKFCPFKYLIGKHYKLKKAATYAEINVLSFFYKDYRESGLKLIYLEEETDFLEGEFAKNPFQDLELQKGSLDA